MDDFEKLGLFYLGKEYDLETGGLREKPVLYESKDLTTHAVCVGMTGSGKTGLCISLLEEALIDGIPAIVIDPKGDICNLLLTFPDLRPEDFRPWINESDARNKGLSPDEYARKQADLWGKGLSQWGQGRDRIDRLKNAGEIKIYTPGSSAGNRVSVMKSFAAPGPDLTIDTDLLRQKIQTTVTGLLNLIGIEADPVQSREYILISTILATAWQDGKDMDLVSLIEAVQNPSFSKVGVFDLESFYPSKERFTLAMRINNILAAPGWNIWLEGDPLDIDRMLYTEAGRPKISIFCISHLGDAERMFFVSILLAQMLDWMRQQPGTRSLRALFYMDEIFGYFPPVANPPSKSALLTLLKQARAFGLGIILATQNPADLDYKGLSNTGTWFIGRLQTERDKDRLLEGLETANNNSGGAFDRKEMTRILSSLGNRVFLMNNVHEDSPVIFQTRWVMSYLRGPVTLSQIRLLTSQDKPSLESAPPSKTSAALPQNHIAAETSQKDYRTAVSQPLTPPILPPEIRQCFLPVNRPRPAGASLFYEPMLLAGASIYFNDPRPGISAQTDVFILAELIKGALMINWDDACEINLTEDELASAPMDGATFADLPPEALKTKNYTEWNRSLKEWLYRNRKLDLLLSPSLKIVSRPGENERDFRIRLQLAAHENRDALIEKLRNKYETKILRLKDRIRNAEYAVEREKEQAKQQKLQTAISFGATVFSALLGRKTISRGSVGRASTTVSRAGRVLKENRDVERAEDNLQALEAQASELENLMTEEIEEIKTGTDPLMEELTASSVKPKKSEISVSLVTIAWAPCWLDDRGGISRAW
ncbi:MAG: DUF87 domain-containing protein [Deltaproteobacteria bacterium]|nr:DUF87 domain-containing protein [Deltaproteobacteria bacterium]